MSPVFATSSLPSCTRSGLLGAVVEAGVVKKRGTLGALSFLSQSRWPLFSCGTGDPVEKGRTDLDAALASLDRIPSEEESPCERVAVAGK